jgi:hypothetical protein
MGKQVTVYATKDQIEEFLSSMLWKDIRRELLMWKREFVNELTNLTDEAKDSNPSTASVMLHIGDINGRTNAVDYLLSLPNVFLQILEDNNKTV